MGVDRGKISGSRLPLFPEAKNLNFHDAGFRTVS
jgi:hypothetical protein